MEKLAPLKKPASYRSLLMCQPTPSQVRAAVFPGRLLLVRCGPARDVSAACFTPSLTAVSMVTLHQHSHSQSQQCFRFKSVFQIRNKYIHLQMADPLTDHTLLTLKLHFK